MTAQVQTIAFENARPTGPAGAGRNLYTIGACAALAVVAAAAIQAPVFILYPPPETIAGHFKLLISRPLIGLLDLDLTLILAEAFSIPVLIALYAALRRSAHMAAAIALGLGLSGIGLFFAVNPTFSMLYLSERYAAAAGDSAQKAALLAAGEALWANYNGTAFGLFFILAGAADLILAWLMLRSPDFSKITAVIGMVMGAMLLIPPLPPFGSIPLALSYLVIIPSVAWQLMVARDLLRLRKEV